MMEFSLPMINHDGIRPSRVPRCLYQSSVISEELMGDRDDLDRVLVDCSFCSVGE